MMKRTPWTIRLSIACLTGIIIVSLVYRAYTLSGTALGGLLLLINPTKSKD